MLPFNTQRAETFGQNLGFLVNYTYNMRQEVADESASKEA